MKYLSIFAAALSLFGSAGAQTLKVSLRSESGPLPYSYVYLNGRAAAVTDTAGVAWLPAGTWSAGDTLAASYVGTTPESRIIDSETVRQGSCELFLSEIYATLTADRVVVRGDVERLFRKTVRETEGHIDGIWGEAQLAADIELRYESVSDGRRDSIAGRITTHRNEIVPRNYMDFDYRLTVEAPDSTDRPTPGAEYLLKEVNRMLRWATAPVYHLQARELSGEGRYLSYLGRKEDCRVFRATFPKVAMNNTSDSIFIQIIAHVDERTKVVRSIEAEYLSQDLTRSTRDRVEYAPYRLMAGWGAGRIGLLPRSIDYRASSPDGRVEGKLRNGRLLSPVCTRKEHRGEPLYAPYSPQAKRR